MSTIAYLAATMDRLWRPHAIDPLAVAPLAVQARHPEALRLLSEAQTEIDRRRQAAVYNGPQPSPSDLYSVEAGVAVIDIRGTLVQELPGWRPFWGMVGYNQIETMVAVALADASARAILLRINSPGGEVAGCFDFVRRLAAARKASAKPIWACASEMACSAAYVGWLHWSIASAEAGRLEAELEVTRLEGAVQRAGAANATLMLNNHLLQQEMVERPAAIVDVVTRVGAFREALADNLSKVLDVDVSRASQACELVPLWLDAWLDGHERLRFEAGAGPGDLRAGAGRGDRAGP